MSFPVVETADQLEKRIVGSWNRKSRVLGWETADQLEKRIVGSSKRKSRDLRWETADECEKKDGGLKSPKSNLGKEGWSLKTTRNKNYIFFFY